MCTLVQIWPPKRLKPSGKSSAPTRPRVLGYGCRPRPADCAYSRISPLVGHVLQRSSNSKAQTQTVSQDAQSLLYAGYFGLGSAESPPTHSITGPPVFQSRRRVQGPRDDAFRDHLKRCRPSPTAEGFAPYRGAPFRRDIFQSACGRARRYVPLRRPTRAAARPPGARARHRRPACAPTSAPSPAQWRACPRSRL